MAELAKIPVSDHTMPVLIDRPIDPSAVALILHPHPILGGDPHHKVPFTLMRSFFSQGMVCYRPTLGGGETLPDGSVNACEDIADVVNLVEYIHSREGTGSIYIAGFSYGAYVAAEVVARMRAFDHSFSDVILCGLPYGLVPSGRLYPTPYIQNAYLIHGEMDGEAPLLQTMEWVGGSNCSITVIPGADHVFNRCLRVLDHAVKERLETCVRSSTIGSQ